MHPAVDATKNLHETRPMTEGVQLFSSGRRPEEARSAEAEHVVALALMGALQNN
jgi:hypothetical protein